MRELMVSFLSILHLKKTFKHCKVRKATICFYQVGHFLFQLQHEHPVLAVLVQRVDDELGQVRARAVGVDFS